MLLSVIQARLVGLVQSYNSVPTTAQYTQAVKDAIDDLSNRRPLVDTTTLNLVDDTADYDLPSDFLRVIRLRAPEAADYYPEEWEVRGLTITFYPTPSTDHDYTLRYCAAYAGAAADDDTEYADIGATEARVLLFEAKSLCLQMISDHVSRDAWTYAEGEQQVNKTKQAEAFRKMADVAHTDYLKAIKTLPVTGRVGLTEMSRSGD